MASFLTVTISDARASAADLVDYIGSKDSTTGMAKILRHLQAICSGMRDGRVRVQFGAVDRTHAMGPSGGASATLTLECQDSSDQIAKVLASPTSQPRQGIGEVIRYLQAIDCGAVNANLSVNIASGTFTATYDEGGTGAQALSTLAAVNGGPTLWYKANTGITEASGAVASWDSVGSNTLQILRTTASQRPSADTVGSIKVANFDGSNDVMVGASAFTLVEPYTVAFMLRVDTFVNGTRLWDPNNANGGHLTFLSSSGNKLSYEQGASDLVSSTAVVNGTWYSLIFDMKGTGTSSLYINGVLDATVAATAAAPTSAVLALGANATSGLSNANITLADLAVWNNVSSPSISQMYAYHRSVAGLLGGVTI